MDPNMITFVFSFLDESLEDEFYEQEMFRFCDLIVENPLNSMNQDFDAEVYIKGFKFHVEIPAKEVKLLIVLNELLAMTSENDFALRLDSVLREDLGETDGT